MDKKAFTPLGIKVPNWRNKRFLTGFTLVEVLVVVSVLGLLAGISIPNLLKAREGSAATICETNKSIIADAIRIWATKEEDTIAGMQAKFGAFPATVDVTTVAGDNVEEYFNPADAVCPLDSTQHYTSTIDNNGLITINCPTH